MSEAPVIRFYLARPTQFEAPFFRFLANRGRVRLEPVFEDVSQACNDPELGRKIDWGFDLCDGYRFRVVKPWQMLFDVASAPGPIIFNGYTKSPLFLAAIVARLLGKKIYLRTDSVILADGTNSSPKLAGLKRILYGYYHGYLVTGASGRRYLREFLKVPEQKRVIEFPYCVDLDAFPSSLESPATCWPADCAEVADRIEKFLRQDQRIPLLVVSKLTEREAPEDLFACFAKYPDLAALFKVSVVGSGDRLAELEALTIDTGLQDTFQFFGYLPYRALPAVYARHAVFYHGPRLEAFGVSVLEAAAAGLYVVTNGRVGASQELSQYSSAVWIYATGDLDALRKTLKQVSLSPPNRSLISDQARSGFSYEKLESRFVAELLKSTV